MSLDHSYSEIDSGPIYKETIYGRWPVEPYNTATTLFFLLLVVFWWWKIRANFKEHLLIAINLPLIAIGFSGGFMYHSCRNHAFWLYLDWGPILICSQAVAIYFWRSLLPSWWKSIALAIAPVILGLMLRRVLSENTSTLTLSYFFLFSSICIPVVIFSVKNHFKFSRYLFFTMVSILLALILRLLDQNEMLDWLPMGSHFLWHTFGALTCYFLINYVYLVKPRLK